MGSKNDKQSCLHHDLVDHAWISLKGKVTFFIDINETRQKVRARNPNLVKAKVTIIHRRVPKFFSNISSLNAGQKAVVFRASNLYHERLHTIVVLANDKSAKYYLVC